MSGHDRESGVAARVFATCLFAGVGSVAAALLTPGPEALVLAVAAIQGAAGALLWRQLGRRGSQRGVADADVGTVLAALAAARKGDLTVRAGVTVGPLAHLSRELNETLEALGRTAGQAAAAAAELAPAAGSIDRASKVLAEGANRQNTAVAEVARKLKALSARSEEIGQIVELLEDVAAETNILALNAAIEASRAGAQGKGFGMVADEVRKLAERSAAATKDIGAFIQGIEAVAHDTGRTVEEIRGLTQGLVASVGATSVATASIVSASQAVTQGLLALRLPGQADTELARALRERRDDLSRALEGLAPLLEGARSPLGDALRQLMGALGERDAAVAPARAPTVYDDPAVASPDGAAVASPTDRPAPATGTG